MNFLRRIVSGKKNRYEGDGYNLDLSYITPRVIAMSLPGEGVHKVYRNSIDSVSRFLNDKHHGNYRIFNCSGIKYDYEKFGASVKEFPWEDHYPPPIELLFYACNEMHQWLYLDMKNVVAVNCRAGKGRTGTLICCYLLYTGRFSDPEAALSYYKYKRFSSGGGVTQPSQVRYVHYFSQVLQGFIKSPNILQLRCVRVLTAPHMSNNSCRPVFEIKSNKGNLFSNKTNHRGKQPVFEDNWETSTTHQIALINTELNLQGDVHCFIYHWSRLKMQKICRFSFNTAFTNPGSTIIFTKQEIDPDNFRNSRLVSEDFLVMLEFDDRSGGCSCSSRLAIEQRCKACSSLISPEEKEKWSHIQYILLEKIQSDPKINLFGQEDDDIEEALSHNVNESCLSSEDSND